MGTIQKFARCGEDRVAGGGGGAQRGLWQSNAGPTAERSGASTACQLIVITCRGGATRSGRAAAVVPPYRTGVQFSSSKIPAAPWPPPTHMVTMP